MLRIFQKFISAISVISMLLIAGACGEKKFKVQGEIYGGDDQALVLEKSDFYGRWTPLDSTKIRKNGNFSISFPAPPSPDIYRLGLAGKYIYFPIDSTETVTLTTSLEQFGREFTLSGSHNAELSAKFDNDLLNFSSTPSDSTDSFKRRIYSEYMKDHQGSIVTYYILTKTVDGKPLFDAGNDKDAKYFAAVATGFNTVRPNDPHTAILEQTSLNAMKRRNANNGKFREVEAEETALIEIELPDENGNDIALSSLTGKGKPVVVVFSILTHPDSPALNIDLAKIYNRLNGKVEFYNVSLDPDQYSWRDAARNIPWVTVFAPGDFAASVATSYNVSALPAFFIYDGEGNLTARVESVDDLDKALR